jgi:DNA-binding response OmpR family regulator
VALSAKNAADGVKLALAAKPDLILMDIMLPGLDGFAATRMLRANDQTSGTPILAATALFRSSDLQACIDAGCTDYIQKPFTFAELEKKIRALISLGR